MADDFEHFLSAALAPEERWPDREFVARVQARIALEERFAAERSAIGAKLGIELLALIGVAAGLVWLARAPAITNLASESPALTLAILLTGFALLTALFSLQTSQTSVRQIQR